MMMGGGMGFLGIGMILFWILLIAVVVLVVRWVTGNSNAGNNAPSPPAQTPLEILKTRYAGGEISKEEYDEMRRVLEN